MHKSFREFLHKPFLISVISLFLCTAIVFCVHANGSDKPLSELEIRTSSGTKHRLLVELATTEEEKNRGLMFRQSMPKNQGMLFLYDSPAILHMWMQNTYIPLDMLFINEQSMIVHIAKNTQPLSLEVISSTKPAIAVLELNAGVTEELSIQKGDRVLHSSLKE